MHATGLCATGGCRIQASTRDSLVHKSGLCTRHYGRGTWRRGRRKKPANVRPHTDAEPSPEAVKTVVHSDRRIHIFLGLSFSVHANNCAVEIQGRTRNSGHNPHSAESNMSYQELHGERLHNLQEVMSVMYNHAPHPKACTDGALMRQMRVSPAVQDAGTRNRTVMYIVHVHVRRIFGSLNMNLRVRSFSFPTFEGIFELSFVRFTPNIMWKLQYEEGMESAVSITFVAAASVNTDVRDDNAAKTRGAAETQRCTVNSPREETHQPHMVHCCIPS